LGFVGAALPPAAAAQEFSPDQPALDQYTESLPIAEGVRSPTRHSRRVPLPRAIARALSRSAEGRLLEHLATSPASGAPASEPPVSAPSGYAPAGGGEAVHGRAGGGAGAAGAGGGTRRAPDGRAAVADTGGGLASAAADSAAGGAGLAVVILLAAITLAAAGVRLVPLARRRFGAGRAR
jgi:hypothetical protein